MAKRSKAPPLYICNPALAYSCPMMYCSYLGRGPCRCTEQESRAAKVDNRPDGRPVPCDNVFMMWITSRRFIAMWDDHAHAVEEDAGPFRDTDAAPEDTSEDTPDTPPDETEDDP